MTIDGLDSSDPVQTQRGSFSIEDLPHPMRIFKSMLPSKTDDKITHLLQYGGLLTALGMYLLFGLWPLSSFILGSAHTVSQVIFHSSYLSINIGIISILAPTIFQGVMWIKEHVESAI